MVEQRDANRRVLWLLIVLIVLILFSMLTQSAYFNQNHMAAAETATIHKLRQIYGLQNTYRSTQGHYANSVGELTSEHEPDDESYVIVMLTNSAGYIVAAAPRSFGKTGRRTFYMDQTGRSTTGGIRSQLPFRTLKSASFDDPLVYACFDIRA